MRLPWKKLLPFAPPATVGSLWMIGLGYALPAVSRRATRYLLGQGYRAWVDEDPPKNPADPAVSWQRAVVWTMASGAIGGLGGLMMRRFLAGRSIPAEGVDMKRKLRRLTG